MGRRSSIPFALRQAVLACLSAVFLLHAGAAVAEDAEVLAQQTKIRAAYLFHFLQLVKWPSEESGAAESPFNICIAGLDPFGELIEVVAKKKARGRNLVIRRLGDAQKFEQCHILYVSASKIAHLTEILKAAEKQEALTVSDCKDFAAKGGMIGFIVVPDDSEGGFRVRFEINLEAARKKGLMINSKLLELAAQVRQ